MVKGPTVPAPEREYQGSRFRVVHCEGALESYQRALSRVEARKAKGFARRLITQISRLASGEPMSQGHFPREGELPRRPGQHGARYFYALKRIPIRGYCWESEAKPGTWFISHYVYKDYDKLADQDVQKVANNWCRIEEDGHDY